MRWLLTCLCVRIPSWWDRWRWRRETMTMGQAYLDAHVRQSSDGEAR